MHIVPLLNHGLLLLAKDGSFAQIGADHEAVSLLAEREDRLPDVHLGNFRVQHDLLYDRSNVFEVLWRRCCAPIQRLRHVIARTKWKRNKDDLANVDQWLEYLDGSHDASITSHESHNDLGSPVVAIHRLLDHLVAPRTVILVQHVEYMAVSTQVLLFKFALNVALLVKELLGPLVTGARVRRNENVVRVCLLGRI